jgi:hypothetical protein
LADTKSVFDLRFGEAAALGGRNHDIERAFGRIRNAQRFVSCLALYARPLGSVIL